MKSRSDWSGFFGLILLSFYVITSGVVIAVYAELVNGVEALDDYVLAIDAPVLSSQYEKVKSIINSLDRKLIRAIDKGNPETEERLLKRLARIEFKLTNRISKRLEKLYISIY